MMSKKTIDIPTAHARALLVGQPGSFRAGVGYHTSLEPLRAFGAYIGMPHHPT
jgi:hypothetical protein